MRSPLRFPQGLLVTTLALVAACGPTEQPGVLPGADVVATDDAGDVVGSDVIPGMCLPTQIACGAACVSPATDPANCGRCGRSCAAGETCMSGLCMGGAAGDGGTTDALVPPDGMTATDGGMQPMDAAMPPPDGGMGPTDVFMPPPDGPAPCPTGQVRCGNLCFDLGADQMNCGACGNACPSNQGCMSGRCVSFAIDSGVMPCPSPQVRCNNVCTDLTTNAAHCGACGRACATGQACVGSSCVAMDSGVVPCPGTQIRCDNVCTDLSSSAAHCGGCGRPCASGQTCVSGMCMTVVVDSGVAPCPGTQVRCNNVCTDLSSSAANCGGCGRPCGSGQTCMSGLCVTPAMDAGVVDSGTSCGGGTTLCGGACVNTATSNAHCGSCGNACSTGTSCISGACRPVCASGQVLCGPSCVSLATDRNHCGACDRPCAGGQLCTGGVCVAMTMDAGVTCSGGLILCGGMCVNPATSQDHCSRCNNRCTGNTACINGSCQSTMTPTDGGTPSDGGGLMCAGGQTACSGVCRDLNFDPNNCGSCGRVCPSGNYCDRGTCYSMDAGTTCGTGLTNCSGTCRDLNFDTNNCGACGRACPSGNYCDRGTCMAGGGGGDGGMCAAGQTVCSGVCRDLNFDPNNCGSCGRVCPSGNYCDRGTCRSMDAGTTCGTGLTNCSGTCRDLNFDSNNCGSCGRVCPSGNYCDRGTCRSMDAGTTCGTGLTNCSGTCRDLNFDANNCGACGRVCPSGNYCDRATCMTGGSPGDGGFDCSPSEVCGGMCRVFETDPNHCGRCDNRCGTGQLCILGNCITTSTCTMGTTLCSGICTLLNVDDRHCGRCGNQCPTGQQCNNGTCGPRQ